MEYKEYELNDLLPYEQPSAYIVSSEKYSDAYETPVLTAGKTFILGYTNETEGIFDKLPVIIFDDFTTATQFVDFKFKVKSSAMKILNINTELVLPKYIYYRLQDIHIDHSTHKRYWIQQFSKIKIKIPPIPEQKKIVDKIEKMFSSLENSINTLAKTKSLLVNYRQAILKNNFEPRDKWKSGILGDVITVLTDYHANGSYKILKENVTLYDKPNYAIMVRSTNFEKNDFVSDLKYIDKHAYEFLKKSQLFGGEVLMGKIGNAGKVYYMTKLNQPASLAMNMFAMRFNESVLSKYAYYFLLSPNAQTDIKHYVKGVGTPTIDKNSVRNIKFTYPDINEQKEIISNIESQLSSCDSILKFVNTTLIQAEAMKHNLLRNILQGGIA